MIRPPGGNVNWDFAEFTLSESAAPEAPGGPASGDISPGPAAEYAKQEYMLFFIAPRAEVVERGFSPKGRPPVLPVETKRQRVNMISAISSQGKVRFMIYQDTMNQQRLIRFMERLIRSAEQKVFLVLDIISE